MESHWNTAPGGYASSSTGQAGHPGDWQEEIYQRIIYMKNNSFAELREIHQKLSLKLTQLDDIVPVNARAAQVENLKHFKMVLERLMTVISLSKHQIQMGLKDKLPLYEKQILHILHNHKKRRQQQSQAGAPSEQPRFHSFQQPLPSMQSQQLPQQHQLEQMDNHPNQLHQQLNTMTLCNNLSMPNAMQQRIQNTLQSHQFLANGMGFGSLQQGFMNPTNSMNPMQMVGSGAANGSSNISHAVTMAEETGLKDKLPHYGGQILVHQKKSEAEANPTMDSNWNYAQRSTDTGPSSSIGADSSGDWRLQLQPDARQRIVYKIMDTLKRLLLLPVPEELNELLKIAVRFEGKVYSTATSEDDYLRKISLKMLSMETKTQPALNASLPNQNRIDPEEMGLKGKLSLNEKHIIQNHKNVCQQQSQAETPFFSVQSKIPPLHLPLPGLQSQQLQQLEQMDNHPNPLQLQSNIRTMTQSNSSSMPNTMQQGIQNTLQSDQLLTKDAERGHPACSSVRKPRKCKICRDCVHKRR